MNQKHASLETICQCRKKSICLSHYLHLTDVRYFDSKSISFYVACAYHSDSVKHYPN